MEDLHKEDLLCLVPDQKSPSLSQLNKTCIIGNNNENENLSLGFNSNEKGSNLSFLYF